MPVQYHQSNTHTHINVRTYRNHLDPTHMKWLLFPPARRLDLNMIPRPTAHPQSSLLRAEPFARELAECIVICTICLYVGIAAEGRETWYAVPEFARPVVRPKVIEHPHEHFVHLRKIITVLSL